MAAHGANMDADAFFMGDTLESPADEEGVHDSFCQLIQEQSQDLNSYKEAIEMSPVEIEEESRDDFLDLRGSGNSVGADGCGSPTDPFVERWSSDTLKVLSSMPSRTIGRSQGAILSQCYNRTMQLCRRRQSQRPAIHSFSRSGRPSICGYRMQTDSARFEAEESKRDRLINNLQNLSVGDRERMLKAIPLNLAEKRELRRLAYTTIYSPSLSEIPCCSQFKYNIIITLRNGWYSWLSFISALQLWQTALKRVSGRFGTGVLSYFVFLRTLLFFNVFLLLVTGVFVVVPQAVQAPVLNETSTVHFGLELLTGAGYFSKSLLYYGYYSNTLLKPSNQTWSSHLSYNMPVAYFFTIGLAFFITCIILVYSMSQSFGQSFRVDRSKGLLTIKVFCSWDFKVIKKSSVKLQSENISTQLKELVAEVNRKKVKWSWLQCLTTVSVQALAWLICVGTTITCALAVFYFSEYMHKDLQNRVRSKSNSSQTPESSDGLLLKEASLLALPTVVSSINLFVPGFFNTVAWMEEYDSPSKRNYVAIFRNLMLKVSVLGVLCFHWLGRVADQPDSVGLQCWESFVGQELYRFLLMDFIFTMLDTLIGEFLWRLFTQKVLKKKRKPVFDIARNVLELIYGQTLAWLGVLFAPVLPAVQVIKLLLLFYLKKMSLMMNCQAPRKPWRASQMTTFFITLLCFPSFLGASVSVTYTMWTIKPSGSCGPFRGLNTMFQAGKSWMKDLADTNPRLSWLRWAHTYLVENPLFLFLAAGVFLIVIYFHSQVVDGQRKIVELLQEQIENEGEDKKFLIMRLQEIHERRRPTSPRRTRTMSEESSFS
ncbi:transmembrane channel-like protein 6b [Brachyhypopomus gauderio]|uniref:transmembrane channel-like protein 6b n=1 Tax=Brachyhypopomus gauderio TaxID=698409 RepID=UPI004041FC00